jgi:hypothetical protein
MTLTTLRPDTEELNQTGVTINGGGGGATRASVVADDSDSSFVELAGFTSAVRYSFPDAGIAADRIIVSMTARVRMAGVATQQAVYMDLAHSMGESIFRKSFSVPVAPAPTSTDSYTFTAIPWDPPTLLPGPDEAAILIARPGISSFSVRLYYLALDIVHAARATVAVNAFASSPVTTSTPQVTWSTTVDTAAGSLAKYQVKVFTPAQVAAPGFNPTSSPATYESGEVPYNGVFSNAHTVVEPLLDGSWRAYVRVSQTVGGSDEWSAWDNRAFTIDAVKPTPPTVTAVAEHQLARIRVDVADTAIAPNTDLYEVQRSTDGGASWETIRSDRSDGYHERTGSTISLYDYELGNGTQVVYRARAINVTASAPLSLIGDQSPSTDPAAWHHRRWWIKSPTAPELNMPIDVNSLPSIQRPVRQGIYQPLGRVDPIVVSDTRGYERGTVRFACHDSDERAKLNALLDTNAPLLVQAPPRDGWPDRYVMFGDLDSARTVDKSWIRETLDTLPWVTVAKPIVRFLPTPDLRL